MSDEALKLLGVMVPTLAMVGIGIVSWINGSFQRKQVASVNDLIYKAMDQLRKDVDRKSNETDAARKESQRLDDRHRSDFSALRSDFDVERGRMAGQIEAARIDRDKLDDEVEALKRRELLSQQQRAALEIRFLALQGDYERLIARFEEITNQLKGRIAMNEEQQAKLTKAADFMKSLGLTDAQIEAVLSGAAIYEQMKAAIAAHLLQESASVTPPASPVVTINVEQTKVEIDHVVRPALEPVV